MVPAVSYDNSSVLYAVRNGNVLIDVEDINKISPYKWKLRADGYVVAWRACKTILIHRLILDAPAMFEVDHINHDLSDNRKANLRLVNRQQNNCNNRQKVNKRGKYKGTLRNGKRWGAKIQSHWIGTYDTEEEAALAYDKMAAIMYGEFAYLNFPPKQ